MTRGIISRVSPEFKRELEDIKVAKIKNNTSKIVLSDRRITKALIHSSLWLQIKELLIEAIIKDDRWRNGYEQ